MDRKLDRRQQYTIRVLQEAYVDLLETSSNGEVTVVDLCRKADVNRSTFYYYYSDIDDLKNRTISYLFGQFFAVLKRIKGDPSAYAREYIRSALDITLEHKKLCRLLLCGGRHDLVTRALEDNLSLIRREAERVCASPEIGALSYGYFCGGMARLWIGWIESDFAAPVERVAELVEAVIVHYYEILKSVR